MICHSYLYMTIINLELDNSKIRKANNSAKKKKQKKKQANSRRKWNWVKAKGVCLSVNLHFMVWISTHSHAHTLIRFIIVHAHTAISAHSMFCAARWMIVSLIDTLFHWCQSLEDCLLELINNLKVHSLGFAELITCHLWKCNSSGKPCTRYWHWWN